MEEFEAHPVVPLSRTNGGEQAPVDHRFSELQQAARRNRMNGNRVNGDTDGRVRPMLLAANVLASFVATISTVVYALYGDAPFVQMAGEIGFFLLRQLSVVRDLTGGILSFSLF